MEENIISLRKENDSLRKLIRSVCAEDGYSCRDCASRLCPFSNKESNQ